MFAGSYVEVKALWKIAGGTKFKAKLTGGDRQGLLMPAVDEPVKGVIDVDLGEDRIDLDLQEGGLDVRVVDGLYGRAGSKVERSERAKNDEEARSRSNHGGRLAKVEGDCYSGVEVAYVIWMASPVCGGPGYSGSIESR